MAILRRCLGMVWHEARSASAMVVLLLGFTSFLGGISVISVLPLVTAMQGSQPDSGESSLLVHRILGALKAVGIDGTPVGILCFLLTVVCLKALVTVCAEYIVNGVRLELEIRKKRQLYERILYSRMESLYTMEFGRLANTLIHETRTVGMLVEYSARLVASSMFLVVYLGVVFVVSWRLTVACALVAGLFYCGIRKIFSSAHRLGKVVTGANNELQGVVHDTLEGYRVVKSLVVEDRFLARLSLVLARIRMATLRVVLLEVGLRVVFEPIMLTGLLAVYSMGFLSLAGLATFAVALNRMYACLQGVQTTHFKISRNVPALAMYEDTFGSIEGDGNSSRMEEDFCGVPCIELKSVGFGFASEDKKAGFRIENLDLYIPAGKTVGVVGRSGAGKSTLIDLLLGLIEAQEGSILVDGKDLSHIDIRNLRSTIGYVPQEVWLLNGTIRENVLLGAPHSTNEALKDALIRSNSWDFVSDLPSGLDTVVGERGVRLSGGQKQRIALARCLIRNPRILLLDEATSALDNESERSIRDAIDDLAGEMTIVIVAHRLGTVRHADTIYVLDEGRVVEKGSYADLLQHGGLFSRLHTSEEGCTKGA